ncbi:MAG TPA: S46 family peptidase [Candidatus Bacteroides pullicola]|uniref:Dipeptidyl-peptidase n=1 Tax=Candidatus Bacteroides pullicola TaxID=2838475 RepID=A0A9D2CIT4_9BACE|nr:S46 family peptidase [Candidatus Bacteroides pullicola]
MKRFLLTVAILTSAYAAAKADEGMWMLTDLKQQNAAAMMELGLQIPVESIYNPDSVSLKDAVVQFGGGCTGEVISGEGLVLTNHHCGYAYIQQHSSVEHDYLTDGFWAMSRREELPCKGLSVTFIDRILDITDYVQEQLKHDPDPQGINYLSPKYLKEVAVRFALEEGLTLPKGYKLELKAFYGGNRYYLFIKKVYTDIRMVGAPPSSIGKFGADTDNWMWPRHTGDFSLFRIYATANGEPADYSPVNMPLRVKNPLKISLKGYNEGDFAFVMGFPGTTFRYMISSEVRERMETTNFMRIHVRDARQQLLNKEMQADDATRIHYAAVYARSANAWKNALGMNEGLVDLDVFDAKRAQEQELLQWEAARGDTACAAAYRRIEEIVKYRRQALYHQQAIQEALITGMDFMRIPSTTALENALKGKSSKHIRLAADSLKLAADKYFRSVPFPRVERDVAKEMMRVYAEFIPAEQRISIFKIIDKRFKGDANRFIDACFEHSIFGSRENFEEFIEKPTLHKLESDWMVLFKYSIMDGLLQTALVMQNANKEYNRAHQVWVKGMMDMRLAKGLPIYPDANLTLRFTYGQVLPYSPKDGEVYKTYTTLDGVMAKEDPDNWEFVVPEKLKELYRAKDYGHYALPNGQMPVCFIVNTDQTGGNSGSPVFNARGELIGTGFDRNYEGLTGDIAFHPTLQRALCVDIRYTLFIIDKFAGASHLVKEMDIVE